MEVTLVNRCTGLIGDDAEARTVRAQEAYAAQFFNAPARLVRSRRVNGGQYVERTYERDEMAMFSKDPQPTGKRSLLGLGRLRSEMDELRNDVRKEIDGAVEFASSVKNDAKQVVSDFKQELTAVRSEVQDAKDELNQLTNGGPS